MADIIPIIVERDQLRAERDALALRVASLERIGREIVDVADAERLPAFSCFQDMNDALKSTGTGAGLREIVERAVRAGYDFGRENSTRITGPTREEFVQDCADRLSGRPAERDAGDEPKGGDANAVHEVRTRSSSEQSVSGVHAVEGAAHPSNADMERARAWLHTRGMRMDSPITLDGWRNEGDIASLAAEFAAIRRDASATNAAERAVVEAAKAFRYAIVKEANFGGSADRFIPALCAAVDTLASEEKP